MRRCDKVAPFVSLRLGMREEDRQLQKQILNAKTGGRVMRRWMFLASGIIFFCALFINLALHFVNTKRAFNLISHSFSSTKDVTGNRLDSFPPIVLWAWERNEDLSFLNSDEAGVAFLAKMIFLRGESVVVKPRLQSLRVAPSTKLIAVVRIENLRVNKNEQVATLSKAQRRRAATEIVELARRENIAAVQIDFDATLSQRDFYRALIRDVRNELPTDTALSITALASWCMGDNWLEDLPIDEAVPMLFRMGQDRSTIVGRMAAGGNLSASKCRGRAGISTDESDVKFPTSERIYIFHPRAWTPDTAISAINAARQSNKEKFYGD